MKFIYRLTDKTFYFIRISFEYSFLTINTIKYTKKDNLYLQLLKEFKMHECVGTISP